MTSRQKFIRTAQYVFIVFGFVFLFFPPELLPSYYRPRLMGITALIYSFCIQLPALLFPVSSRTSNMRQQLLAREQLQATLSLGLLLSGLGSLGLWGLHEIGIPYDKFIHFIFPSLLMIPGFSLFRVRYGWHWNKTLIFLILIASISSVAWEFVEYSSVRWLRFGFFGQLFDRESILDIVVTLSGVGVAALFLVRRK